MVEPHASRPLGVADLDVGEQFVLWAVRTRLEGAAADSRLERGFELAQDTAMGGTARAAFEAWFHVLASHCWRDLYLHRAPCPCLSADERTMLDLLASAQAGDDVRLRRSAAGLVHPRAIGTLQRYSRIFAAALRRLGLRLHDRRDSPWRAAPATLH